MNPSLETRGTPHRTVETSQAFRTPPCAAMFVGDYEASGTGTVLFPQWRKQALAARNGQFVQTID